MILIENHTPVFANNIIEQSQQLENENSNQLEKTINSSVNQIDESQIMFEYTINTQSVNNRENSLNLTPRLNNRPSNRTPEQVKNNNRISRERYQLRRNILLMNHTLGIDENMTVS